MAYKSKKRMEEVRYRSQQTVKRIITVENDNVSSLPTEEKLKLLLEIEEMGDWRGLYEDMYVTLFDDPDVRVRRIAVSAFWDFPDENYIDSLMRKSMEDADAEVRGEACGALGRYVYEGFITGELKPKSYKRIREFLCKVVKNAALPVVVRRRALESLSFDTGEDILEMIGRAYEEPSTDWRSSAIFAMGRSHLERWHPAILKELHSESRRLRIEAVVAAREGYVSASTSRLCELARGSDKPIRLLAISALAHTGGEGALETLEACALDRDCEIVETAEAAIEKFFGLDEEEPSETDTIDVQLGSVSDIDLADTPVRVDELLKAAEAAAEAADEGESEDGVEDEEPEEAEGEMPSEVEAEEAEMEDEEEAEEIEGEETASGDP
ncbi:MAG: HEAT repeat domain-containing protein [Planctomycetes bacterium]|nr:HEAT repeat domain-containing protein [Planctomycetota bacterium]